MTHELLLVFVGLLRQRCGLCDRHELGQRGTWATWDAMLVRGFVTKTTGTFELETEQWDVAESTDVICIDIFLRRFTSPVRSFEIVKMAQQPQQVAQVQLYKVLMYTMHSTKRLANHFFAEYVISFAKKPSKTKKVLLFVK